MEKIFGEISKQLNEESTLREEIKSVLHEMTATLRSASAHMQQIHGSIKNGKLLRARNELRPKLVTVNIIL